MLKFSVISRLVHAVAALVIQKCKSDFFTSPSSYHWLCIAPTKFKLYSVAYTVLYDLTSDYVVNLKNTISTTFCWGSALDIVWWKWFYLFKNVWKLLS